MGTINGLPLGIGSLPNINVSLACELILKIFPDSPFTPELPKRNWRESIGMEQGQGLPGFVENDKEEQVYFDSSKDISFALETFYEHYLAEQSTAYAVSDAFSPGFAKMINEIKGRGLKPKVLKSQLTGPTTLGLILKDNKKKALLYHDQMMDVLIKATSLKSAWMVSTMADVCDQPMIFFDEPMLQSIGSATIPIDRQTAISMLSEVIKTIDCITGGHCCGNTDWSILMEAGLDIIAFDAWRFMNTLSLYPKELKNHVENGGYIAWGIVPASKEGSEIDQDILCEKLISGIDMISNQCDIPMKNLKSRSLVTPSCGLGSLSEKQAESIMEKTAYVSSQLLR